MRPNHFIYRISRDFPYPRKTFQVVFCLSEWFSGWFVMLLTDFAAVFGKLTKPLQQRLGFFNKWNIEIIERSSRILEGYSKITYSLGQEHC